MFDVAVIGGVVGGSESNIDTVLVLSGVTRAEDLASFPYQSKCVLNGVGDILKEKQERY